MGGNASSAFWRWLPHAIQQQRCPPLPNPPQSEERLQIACGKVELKECTFPETTSKLHVKSGLGFEYALAINGHSSTTTDRVIIIFHTAQSQKRFEDPKFQALLLILLRQMKVFVTCICIIFVGFHPAGPPAGQLRGSEGGE